MATDTTPYKEETSYKKELGLAESVAIVVGRIIGSGIFRTPAPIMALVLSTSLFGLSWFIGGLVTILAAVCYAELVAMLPKSGGPYQYLKMSYPPVWAFLRGWAMFFVSETGAIAAVALVFAEYLSSLYEIAYSIELPGATLIILALALIWVHTAINLFGVKLSGLTQKIFALLKVVGVFAIISICFLFPGESSSMHNFSEPFWPSPENGGLSWSSILAVGAAMRYTFFAFSGWEGATYIAEEVKNPGRNLPLSLFLGIGLIMIVYAGANLAYLYQVPPLELAESKHIATEALSRAVGIGGAIFIAIVVMISTSGNVGTQILVKARSWQAMARDGMFFASLKNTHPKYKTPNRSLILQAFWASVLLIVSSFATNAYEAIIDFFSATGTVFNIMTFASVMILRRKMPSLKRPYKTWLYPASPVIVIIIYSIFLVITLITAPLQSLAGFALTASGLVYYYLRVKPALVKN